MLLHNIITGRTRIVVRFLAVALFLIPGTPAHAHDPSLSGIRLLFRQNDVVVTVSTHISRMVRAEGGGRSGLSPVEIDLAVRRRLHLRIDGVKFVPGKANVIGDSANDLLTWQATMPDCAKTCDVEARLYPEDAASRTVVTILRDGVVVRDALLDEAHPDMLSSHRRLSWHQVAAQYIRQGVLHILSGPDHIAFVIGLLLLGGTLKSLLKTVTAFTLAHSITLSLAATGVWNPSPRIVEPLIALSIVAIAVENLRPHPPGDGDAAPPRDMRPFYAFGFGLIHGFGFAGALSEVGLPANALATALASFNIGVEIGQAAIVLAISPLIALLASKKPVLLSRFVFAASICIGLAGSFWFFTRLRA